jgi:serine/threonine protein phosphatase PrpC
MMRFSVYQESRIGGRRNNQDRMGYCYTRDSLLLLLADGMGGHIQGEVAASIAMQTISARFQQSAQPVIKNPQQFLESSLCAAHFEIHRYRATNYLSETPRTTIVACLVQHDSAFWAHCGDSRMYWMRDGQVLARTRDHSRIETLIEQGKADPSERSTHPDRNKLFNCLGGPNMPLVEIAPRAGLRADDVLLLCSDGLWSVIPDQIMADCLSGASIMQGIPDLIGAATHIAGQNSDNVTALGLVWESDGCAHSVSTGILPPGAVTTTIQPPCHADLDPPAAYTETEMENAIEEIRSAIEVSNRTTLKE